MTITLEDLIIILDKIAKPKIISMRKHTNDKNLIILSTGDGWIDKAQEATYDLRTQILFNLDPEWWVTFQLLLDPESLCHQSMKQSIPEILERFLLANPQANYSHVT